MGRLGRSYLSIVSFVKRSKYYLSSPQSMESIDESVRDSKLYASLVWSIFVLNFDILCSLCTHAKRAGEGFLQSSNMGNKHFANFRSNDNILLYLDILV